MFSDQIVLLARDMEAASELRELVARSHPFHELQTIDAGDAVKMRRFVDSLASGKPDLIFAEVRGFQDLAEVLEPLLVADPMLPLLVYGRKIENHAYLELHRIGFGNRIIHLPARREALDTAIAELRACRSAPPPLPVNLCPMVSFLPGKPGSGASTAAWHFANYSAELLAGRVVLLDLDLNCGVQSLLGAAQTGMNLFDAISVVDHTGQMPDPAHLPLRDGVAILSTLRRCRSSRIDARLFENFLTAARSCSRLVVVDHSGNWERFSVQAMKASSLVFCVCGNDYVSLAQTHRMRSLMEEEGLLGSTRLILNRYGSRFGTSLDEAERVSGLPFEAALPNSFGQLQQAIARDRLVETGSPYSEAVRQLAVQTLKSLRLSCEQAGQTARREASRGWLASLGLGRRRVHEAPPALERR